MVSCHCTNMESEARGGAQGHPAYQDQTQCPPCACCTWQPAPQPPSPASRERARRPDSRAGVHVGGVVGGLPRTTRLTVKLMVKLIKAMSTPRTVRKYQSSPTRNSFRFSQPRPPGAGAAVRAQHPGGQGGKVLCGAGVWWASPGRLGGGSASLEGRQDLWQVEAVAQWVPGPARRVPLTVYPPHPGPFLRF